MLCQPLRMRRTLQHCSVLSGAPPNRSWCDLLESSCAALLLSYESHGEEVNRWDTYDLVAFPKRDDGTLS